MGPLPLPSRLSAASPLQVLQQVLAGERAGRESRQSHSITPAAPQPEFMKKIVRVSLEGAESTQQVCGGQDQGKQSLAVVNSHVLTLEPFTLLP